MILMLFEKGGVVMWPLFIVAIIASYLIVYKLISILQFTVRYRKQQHIEQVHLLLKKGSFDDSRALITQDGPKEYILKKGIDCLQDGVDLPTMKDQLEMIYDDQVHRLESGLSIILILGEIMPMLGLLGTVSGMINVFKAITTYGTGNAQALAGGISEALLTTEVGLVLAIPTMFCYTFLQSKVDDLAKIMRHAGFSVTTVLKAKND